MRRLDRSDWLDHGLQELARHGHGALKAQSLARGLGVTRGSFYWHFDDLAAFQRALVAHWGAAAIAALSARPAEGRAGPRHLEALLTRALRSDAGLERAVRAWAAADADVARWVAAVDWHRVRLAEKVLETAGAPQDQVGPRARLVYWAAIGRTMMAARAPRRLRPGEIAPLAALIAGPCASAGPTAPRRRLPPQPDRPHPAPGTETDGRASVV